LRRIAIFEATFLALLLLNFVPVNAWVYPDSPSDDKVEFFGPRLDRLVIKYYTSEIEEFKALERGEIDFTDWPIGGEHNEYVLNWTSHPDIKLVWRGTEFGMFVLDLNNNPNPYLGNPQNPAYPNPVYPNPMSVPALRHAVAHCVDKDYIVNTICGGFAERLDSYVPSSYGVWSNPAVEIHPYNPTEAAAILDANHFPIDSGSGKRYWDRDMDNAKDPGEEFTLKFYIRSDHALRKEAGAKIAAALSDSPVSLPVNATYADFMTCLQKVMTDKNFHLYTGGWGLSADPDQGYFLYHIDMYWHPGRPLNYDAVNDTAHNYWTKKFITSTNFADALNACYKAQEIFCSEDCIGAIPLWASAGYTAYRKRYTGGTNEVPVGDGEDIYRGRPWLGVVNEKGFGTWSWYTFYNAHPEGFELGDGARMTARWGFRVPNTASLNPLYAEWVWDWYILGKSYDSMITLNPNTLEDVPYIAYNWTIDTWVPSAGPYAGQTLSKVTFYMRDDVYWSDGTPLTAEDVKFTWGGPLDTGSISWWLKKRGLPPAYWSANVADILSISTPDPWTVEVYLDISRYFAYHYFSYHGMSGWNIILPKHIWEPIVNDKIGDSPYGDDPTKMVYTAGPPGTVVPTVCSGPYIIGPYSGVEPSITLTANPLHFNNPRRKAPIDSVLRLVSPVADTHIIRGELCLSQFTLCLHNLMYDIAFGVDKYFEVQKWNTATSSWDVVLPEQFLGHEDLPTCEWRNEALPSLTLDRGLYNIKVAIKVVSPTTSNPWLNRWINQNHKFWVTIKEDIVGQFQYGYEGKGFQSIPDLKVDMKDVGAAAKAFGSYSGHARWNSYADINGDHKVDMKDIGAIAKKFGWASVPLARFCFGDAVEVCNTGGLGLRVRDAPAGNVIGKKYDGDRGVIVAGPESAVLDGIAYTWWKIRWDDALEGWSAEGYPRGVDYLRQVYVSPPSALGEVWIEPSSLDLAGGEIGDRFTVVVWGNVAGSPALYAWQVKLRFPGWLNCTSVGYSCPTCNAAYPHNAMRSEMFHGKSTVPVNPVVDNVAKFVMYGESLQGVGNSSGNRRLMWAQFEIIAVPGEFEQWTGVIECYSEDTFFLEPMRLDVVPIIKGRCDLTFARIPNQPPVCIIRLQKDGVETDKVDVGEFFDIYVGDSTDDTGIVQVRFSSDDAQDGIPTGEWTEWYNWTASSGDWNASTKIKRWAFATTGDKEVWAEVKDDMNQTSNRPRNIRATINGKSTEYSAGDCVKIWKYSLLYKEPRLDSESHYIYEDKWGRIIENENNGIFADGHFWWYIKVELFEYWVWEEAIIKNQPPIPSLIYAPKHPKANEEVIFDASESQDRDGKIKFYKWYLDGKFKGMTENPIIFYAFEKEGTFSLKVEVIDDCLESTSEEVTIKVEGKTRPEKIKKIISKDDLIRIADDLGIPHYTAYCGLWCQIEYFQLNDETYSEDELLAVFNKLIKKINEIGEVDFSEDVVYGMKIRNILEDAKLVDLTSRSTWSPQKDDFKNLKRTNTWAETIVKLAQWEAPLLEQLLKRVAFLLEMPQLHVVGALIGPILKIAEGYKVYNTLDFLEDVLYKRALWHYLQLRIGGEDSITAFDSIASTIPPEYFCDETRAHWEKLYEKYEPYIIPEVGGLGENFEKIKTELKKHIYDIMDSYSLMPRKFVRIGSVGELQVYDSEGRVTGLINGEVTEEIPYSMYDEETKTIIIFPAIDHYYYKILGRDEGTYSLEITSVEYVNTTTFIATDIPTSSGTTHRYTIDWDALSQGEEGVTVMVDSDGDGVFEHIFTSDSELTQSEFLAETTLLGDLNGDGKIDIRDIAIVARAFGETPERPRWNPQADINKDSQIDIRDIAIVAKNFGKTYT
jgi:ABC-type transport system substrate-binding protein